jgi:hypothetical protein
MQRMLYSLLSAEDIVLATSCSGGLRHRPDPDRARGGGPTCCSASRAVAGGPATLAPLHFDGCQVPPHHPLERVVARYPRPPSLRPRCCRLRQSILLRGRAVAWKVRRALPGRRVVGAGDQRGVSRIGDFSRTSACGCVLKTKNGGECGLRRE